MPQLSDTMTEGTVVKWRKREGEAVKEGEVIAEVETDKATMEMEAFESGTLAVVAAQEGQKVKVGDRLAVLATGGEKVQDVRAKYGAGAAPAKASAPAPVSTQVPVAQEASSTSAQAPQAVPGSAYSNLEEGWAQLRRESVQVEAHHSSEAISRQAQEALSEVRGSSVEQQARSGEHNGGRVKISPLARKIAKDRKLDLSQIRGSGPGGRIIQRDVVGVSEQKPAPIVAEKAAAEMPVRVARGQTQVIPLTKMRSAIAAALQKSKSTVPHFYETIDIDVEQVVRLREGMNKQLEGEKIRLSVGDFVSLAVTAALQRHPALNATFNGTEITRHGDVNLGMAVAIPDGLIVPVLRGVDQMGLKELRVRSADLVERARSQRLKREELSGATFTISNLGQFGIRDFSAIINSPEVGILAVGVAEKRAVVRGDAIVARTMMSVTLSCDHRAVDGATAAEFMRTLKALLEEPGMMLIR